MNLLYLSFGNHAAVHMQAAFSIYSFLTQKGNISSINIITDSADFYKHFGSRVNVIPVTKEEFTEWKGQHDFFWRIKIKAIERMCHLYPGKPVVYLDADTFLYSDISGIKNSMQNGMAFMHENEGALSGKKSKTEKKMWQQIAGKEFGNILMKPSDCMWNAGVVAIPNTKNGKDCELALAICDAMCDKGVTKRLIEQYALSLALKNVYGLSEAKQAIAHYWSAKETWNNKIISFFMEAHFAQWDYSIIIEKIKLFDTISLPVRQRTRNTNIRLTKMVNKIFPVKDTEYLTR